MSGSVECAYTYVYIYIYRNFVTIHNVIQKFGVSTFFLSFFFFLKKYTFIQEGCVK